MKRLIRFLIGAVILVGVIFGGFTIYMEYIIEDDQFGYLYLTGLSEQYCENTGVTVDCDEVADCVRANVESVIPPSVMTRAVDRDGPSVRLPFEYETAFVVLRERCVVAVQRGG